MVTEHATVRDNALHQGAHEADDSHRPEHSQDCPQVIVHGAATQLRHHKLLPGPKVATGAICAMVLQHSTSSLPMVMRWTETMKMTTQTCRCDA